MERMRVEMFGNSALAREIVPQIDAVILLDRSVDLLTPLSTQLTYEGLIDEVFGIKHCEYILYNNMHAWILKLLVLTCTLYLNVWPSMVQYKSLCFQKVLASIQCSRQSRVWRYCGWVCMVCVKFDHVNVYLFPTSKDTTASRSTTCTCMLVRTLVDMCPVGRLVTWARGMYVIYMYCTEARGCKAAWGLSAINAMHPECVCYNYFISRGHSVTILP